MFVKIYKYKINQSDFQKWNEVTDLANTIYKKYGGLRFERLAKDISGGLEIMELGYYESKEEFDKIIRKVDIDPNINKLFTEFKKLVKSNITEEEFITF